jgi:hypothetical protein
MTNESILNEIKKMLGIAADYDAFDTDIKIHINAALTRLSQLGVKCVAEKIQITGNSETWTNLFGEVDDDKLNQIQEFVYLKTKLVFDPPASATINQSYENRVKELEWEINVVVDK